jgi:hypothetical protein
VGRRWQKRSADDDSKAASKAQQEDYESSALGTHQTRCSHGHERVARFSDASAKLWRQSVM